MEIQRSGSRPGVKGPESTNGSAVEWLEKVTDEQYLD